MAERGEEACQYCRDHPSRADPSVWKDLPSRKDGGLFFSPVPSSHPGHYETFLEMKARKRAGRLEKIVPDDCFSDLEFWRCEIEDCFYVYRSAIDRVRHLMQIHKATKKDTNFDGSFTCKFKLPNGELCGFKGKTQHYLKKHKDEEKHKIRIHKKSNEPETPKERKKAQKQAKKAKKQVRKKKKQNEFLDDLSIEDEEQGEDEPEKMVAQKKQAKTKKKKPASTLEEMENLLQEEESDFSDDELGEEEELGSSDEEDFSEEEF